MGKPPYAERHVRKLRLGVRSYTTRRTSGSAVRMRSVTRSSRSLGRRLAMALLPPTTCTARRVTTNPASVSGSPERVA